MFRVHTLYTHKSSNTLDGQMNIFSEAGDIHVHDCEGVFWSLITGNSTYCT